MLQNEHERACNSFKRKASSYRGYNKQPCAWYGTPVAESLFYEKHYSATVLDDGVDYVKLSEAMGATARRVKTQEEFEKHLQMP